MADINDLDYELEDTKPATEAAILAFRKKQAEHQASAPVACTCMLCRMTRALKGRKE